MAIHTIKWRRQWHPPQCSHLENPMDGGAWWAAVHGVAKSQTRLSDCTFTFHFHALEREMATHSSVPAWRIPGTAKPGGLSMGSHRVGHDWSDLAAAAAAAWKERDNGRFIFFFPPSSNVHHTDIFLCVWEYGFLDPAMHLSGFSSWLCHFISSMILDLKRSPCDSVSSYFKWS